MCYAPNGARSHVTVAVPDALPEVAVTVTVPPTSADAAVKSPAELIDPRLDGETDQVTVGPLRTSPI